MTGRRSGSRRREDNSFANRAPTVDRRLDLFDRSWLSKIQEVPDIRYVDLTKIEDRRRYDPSNPSWQRAKGQPARNLNGTFARVVVVPEGHSLARLQTYRGRYSLSQLYRYHAQNRLHPHHARGWQRVDNFADYRYGYAHQTEYRNYPSHKLGFALPWQVVICVRRKRRKEVIHALGIAGAAGVRRRRRTQRRNAYSEIRC